jgi:hypothetical protein
VASWGVMSLPMPRMHCCDLNAYSNCRSSKLGAVSGMQACSSTLAAVCGSRWLAVVHQLVGNSSTYAALCFILHHAGVQFYTGGCLGSGATPDAKEYSVIIASSYGCKQHILILLQHAGMQFYTGGFLGGGATPDAKDGAAYPRFAGLCIETQVNVQNSHCQNSQ